MKIVYLSASNVPSRSANGIQVMRMCEALARNAHETTLIAKQFTQCSSVDVYKYYGVEKNFELHLIRCRKVKGVNIFTLPKLYRALRSYDPRDVLVYARDIYGASLAAGMGYRLLYESHGLPYNALIRHLEYRLLNSKSLIRLVVISHALERLYRSSYHVSTDIVVSHDGASLPNMSVSPDYPWPASRQTLQIGYTGHLYKGRGIEIIMECAKRLTQYDFHVIGGADDDLRYWKGRATENLRFHGFVEPSVIPAMRSRCDILLMPYQRDLVNPHSHANTSAWMSPMKLFEYMASQRAIVASDLPVLREVLDETMAVLIPPDDPEAWVEAIRRCEDRQYREDLARNAHAAFLEHYTWEKRAHKVLDGLSL